MYHLYGDKIGIFWVNQINVMADDVLAQLNVLLGHWDIDIYDIEYA